MDRNTPQKNELEGLKTEERFILGEARNPMEWWLPGKSTAAVLNRFS